MPNRAQASPHQAIVDRDILLATKLYVPVLRPGLVPRALNSRISWTMARPGSSAVVAVCWLRQDRVARRVGSSRHPSGGVVVPGRRRQRPGSLLAPVVAALEDLYPGIRGRVGSLLGPPAPLSFDGVVTGLINQIAADPAERDTVLAHR